MSDTYDKSSKLLIANEDLEQAKFLKTILDRIAVRVGNESGSPLYTTRATPSLTPKGTVISIPNKLVKTAYTFTTGTKKLLIRSEKVTEIKYNYNEVDYDAGKKLTVTSGGSLLWDTIEGGIAAGTKIFLDVDKDNIDLEITEWT